VVPVLMSRTRVLFPVPAALATGKPPNPQQPKSPELGLMPGTAWTEGRCTFTATTGGLASALLTVIISLVWHQGE
jgi:hypothetical protein